jgi:hypothetical protein
MIKNSLQKKFPAWIFIAFGGIIFLATFAIAYQLIDPNNYQFRDDGVITFSHAKNLIDFGFVGVNPSGERLEGYSAPVQFLIFAISYFLTGASYGTFVFWQTLASTFLLGSIFTAYFIKRPNFSLFAAFISALGLTLCSSFIEWHGSGMENSITHVLFAAVVLVLYSFALNQRVNFYWAPLFFLAGISRLDGIYHILPILLLFAIYWGIYQRSAKGLYLLLLFIASWVLYQFWRYFYFGDFSSNTLIAQHIDLRGRISAILTREKWYYAESYKLAKTIFINHSGFLLFIAVPLMFFSRWNRSRSLLFALSLLLVGTALFNPYLFGETRLDPTRSTTQMAFFIFVAFFCILDGVSKRWLILLASVFALATVFFMRTPPYYLCCGVNSFEPVQIEARQISLKENIFRPTFANPDLGLMSWSKEFNVLDIGMLGSPIFAKVRQGPLLADYFYDFAAPDLIESHETWSCQYLKTLFLDPRFRKNYSPIRETSVHYGACGDTPLPKGIWIRKDIVRNSQSPERRLMDDMTHKLSVSRLKRELVDCQKTSKSPSGCSYVARTAYRFLPELRASGVTQELNDVFQSSESRDFDLFIINGYKNAQAYKSALESFVKNYLNTYRKQMVLSSSGFLVGIDRNFLVVIKPECTAADLSNPIYITYKPYPNGQVVKDLHAPPRDSFGFMQKGFKTGSSCMASFELDNAKAPFLDLVGQWIPEQEKKLWGEHPAKIAR